MTDDIPELTEADFDCAMRRDQRKRLMAGEIRAGEDIAALRSFAGLTQVEFAKALGICRRSPRTAGIR